ncbi:hypothetical protein MKW92_045646 [Papaver armeniacum]|nr:hypothetical protein MKW92_045646 [Papaver armeniacum]
MVQMLLLNANVQNQEESYAKIANIQQLIMKINALIKSLDVLLQILVVFPKVDPLQRKVMSFIHRMVEVLGSIVFPSAAMIGSRMLSIAFCFCYLVWCQICRNGRVSSQYVELKFDHINGNVCNYGPPYECQLASLLRAGVMDLI